jgi:outer membrane receptor for ferrienterochelin and colicins
MNIKIKQTINVIALSCLYLPWALAQADTETHDTLEALKVESIEEILYKKGAVKDVIVKTEVITARDMQKSQANNLSEAIANEPGITSNTGCSMCGMKRIRINGLKGEHTTVIVDDVPINSTVSSYYGTDALTTAGLASVEIARGAGASLLAPEAIGGTINVISKKAEKNSLDLDVAAGSDRFRKLSMVAAGVSKNKKTRLTTAAQYTEQGQWDADNNGVNESPALKNFSLNSALSHTINDRNEVELKINRFSSNVFGGMITPRRYWAIMGGDDASQAEDFADGDVRKQNTGGAWGYTEAIETDRNELILDWRHVFNDRINLHLINAGAWQTQESLYEGTDYHNDNYTAYSLLKFNILAGQSHLITIGADHKWEGMYAKSSAFGTLLDNGNYIEADDFEFRSFAFFLQDAWMIRDNLELNVALRGDKIYTDWLSQEEEKYELDEFVIAPRFHLRWDMIPELSMRISAGRGYRAPLSFFESEHGLTETGYLVRIDALEDSWGANASLSLNTARATATASYGYTQVENLATFEEEEHQLVLRNLKEKALVQMADIVAGYTLIDWLTLSASYEHFFYDDAYKSSLTVAAVEQRVRAMLDIDFDKTGTEFNLTFNFVGARNLADYGYEGRYNVKEELDNGDIELSSPKKLDAPAYFTMDAFLMQKINNTFNFYLSAKNFLNYTQTDTDGISPLFWDEEGNIDVGHIYGELRGRQLSAGFTAKF